MEDYGRMDRICFVRRWEMKISEQAGSIQNWRETPPLTATAGNAVWIPPTAKDSGTDFRDSPSAGVL